MRRFQEVQKHLSEKKVANRTIQTETDSDNSKQLHAFKVIMDTHAEVANMYDSLSDPWARKSLRNAIAKDENVLKVEAAIARECEALRSDADESRKEEAAKRIIQGMEYWFNMLAKRIHKHEDGKRKATSRLASDAGSRNKTKTITKTESATGGESNGRTWGETKGKHIREADSVPAF